MVGSTQIVPFAIQPGANVQDPVTYAANVSTLTGYQSGIAESIKFNTTLRQSAFMAAALANFIADEGLTQNDDGDLPNAVSNIAQAIRQLVGAPTVFTGATTTGSANAQVLATVVPATGFGLVNGYTVVATAGFTNTGAMTLNVASTGPVDVNKLSGASLVPLTGSEITATNNFSVTYNSTAGVWVLNDSVNLGALAYLNIGAGLQNDGSGNLTISPAGSACKSFSKLKIVINSNTQGTITGDVVAENAGGQAVKLRNVNVTYSTAGSGANGLDTGTIANNTWYYEYVIYNPTTSTVAALISLSATAPTLPSGYTFSIRVGACYFSSASGGALYWKNQYGAKVGYVVGGSSPITSTVQLATGVSGSVTTPTWTATSIAAAVPPTAGVITISGSMSGTAAGIGLIAPNGNYPAAASNDQVIAVSMLAGAAQSVAQVMDMVIESSNIYYASNTSQFQASCLGYVDNL